MVLLRIKQNSIAHNAYGPYPVFLNHAATERRPGGSGRSREAPKDEMLAIGRKNSFAEATVGRI